MILLFALRTAFVGSVVSVIPILFFVEIYQWIRNEPQVRYPLLKGISLGVVVGLVIVYLTGKTASGYVVIGAFITAPFLFSACVLAGVVIGIFYYHRDKVLLTMLHGRFSPSRRLLIFLIVLSSCVLLRLLFFLQAGTILDKDTGKTLEGAIISRCWYRDSVFGWRLEGLEETASSPQGKFWLVGRAFSLSIPLLSRVVDNPTIIYKPGYKLLVLGKNQPTIAMESVPTLAEARKTVLEEARDKYNWETNRYYDRRSDRFRLAVSREQEFIRSIISLKRQAETEIEKIKKRVRVSSSIPHEITRKIGEGRYALEFRGGGGIGVYATPSMKKKIKELSKERKRLENSLGLDDLAEMVRNKEYEDRCRKTAFLAARNEPEMLPYFIEALNDRDTCIRQVAVRYLDRLEDTRTIAPLIEALADKKVSRVAGTALTRKGPAAVEPLIEVLRNGNDNAQREAAIALGSIQDPRAVDPLIELLKLRKPGGSRAAAVALGKYKGQRVTKALVDALEYEKSGPRESARRSLCNRNAESLGLLLDRFKSRNSRVRRDIAQILGHMMFYGKTADSRVATQLVENLKDEDTKIRKLAVWGLSHTKDPEVIKKILSLWRDEDSEVREQAARSLAIIGAPAIDFLLTKLSHTDSYFRWRAAWCLGRIQAPTTIDALVASLADKEAEVRWMAIEALGAIGTEKTIEPLTKMSIENDIGLREIATISLAKIKAEKSQHQN